MWHTLNELEQKFTAAARDGNVTGNRLGQGQRSHGYYDPEARKHPKREVGRSFIQIYPNVTGAQVLSTVKYVHV